MTEVDFYQKRGRDGHGQLVHFYMSDGDINEGTKRAIEKDIADNYRVKIHLHAYQKEPDACDCQVRYKGDEIEKD